MKNRGLAIFLFGFSFAALDAHKVVLLSVLIVMWLYTYEWKTLGLMILCCFAMSLPNFLQGDFNVGTIVEMSSNSVVIQSAGRRVLVSNCHNCTFDDVIKVEGKIKTIESAQTNFGFQFSDWTKQHRVSSSIYATDNEIVRHGKTLRAQIYREIKKRTNQMEQDYLLKLIFNIHRKESGFELLYQLGFGWYGFLILLRKILATFFIEKQVDRIELVFIVLSGLFYHWTFVIARVLIGKLVRYSSCTRQDKVALFGFLCWLFYPEKMMSLTFLIPFGFRLIQVLSFNKNRLVSLNFIFVIQSISFNQVNLFFSLFYRAILKVMGVLYLLAGCQIYVQIFNSHLAFIIFIQAVEKISSLFIIHGNCVGWGIIPFCILQNQQKRKGLYFSLSFLLFLRGGLFHPLTEVSFLQIGQGDSILIHSLIYNKTVVVDTGKASQYALLRSNLQARGISKIDALIVSHDDEDHNGGLKQLQDDFKVVRIIRNHQDYEEGDIYFKSLNDIQEDSTNSNSLVHLLKINGLKILLTGDIPVEIEQNIVQKWPKLEVDVLKLAHHGSKTSSSLTFLDHLKPKLAIVSSGVNNSFSHPSLEIVKRLENLKISMLNTANDGDISLYFTSIFNFVLTSSQKFGIIKWVIK
ncbi:MAG: ComEC/Rec2 family competence protein [Anaerorhabdus sp.]